MKQLLPACSLFAVLTSCSTVQVAQFDKSRPPTTKVDFYRADQEIGKPYKEIGYLAHSGAVTPANETAALGKLLNQARKLGADALILKSPNLSGTNATVFSAVAIVYEQEKK